MSIEVERMVVRLEAQIGQYTREISRAQAQTNASLGAIEGRFAAMSARLKASTSTAALGIGSAFAGIGAYLGTQQIISYADSWRTVERTLEAGREVFGVTLRSVDELNKLANDARVDNEAYAKLYTRTAAAVRELGVAEEDVAKATSTVAMALKLGTASASEQASTMLQLSQALQKGKLDGDEFRTVMENAGVVQELLAEKLKVSKGAIITMAAEGKLKVEQLFGALVEGNEKVERIFRRLPSTIEEGFIVLNNQVEQYIGHLNNAYGGTDAFLAVLKTAAENVEPVADSIVALGAALLAAFSPRIIASVAMLPLALGAAMGPLGLLLGAVGGGAVAIDLFGDTIAHSADGLVTLQDAGRALASVLMEELSAGFDRVNALLAEMGDATNVSSTEVIDAIKGVFNILIGGVSAAVQMVASVMPKIPAAMAEALVDTVNAMRRGMQALLDTAAEGVNNIISALNTLPGPDLGFLVVPDLGQAENDFAGAGQKLGVAFVGAMSSITRDYFADAAGQAEGFFARVEKRAADIATTRRFAPTVVRDLEKKPTYPGAVEADKRAEKARAAFEKDLLAIEARIDAERLEAEAVGRSAYEVERMRIEQDLLNEARKAGVTLTDADRIKVAALSDAYARATTEAQALRDAFALVGEESKSTLSAFVRDLKDGKDGADALSSALDNIANRLIDMAINDLVETALGGLSGRGGAAAGPSLGAGLMKLFGFADGGVMIPGRGPANLPRFAAGGVSRSAAIFGEAGPEAAVPLPDGRRIPVDLRIPTTAKGGGGGGPMQVNVAPVFNVQNGTPDGIVALKAQVAAELPSMIKRAVHSMLDRDARVARLRG